MICAPIILLFLQFLLGTIQKTLDLYLDELKEMLTASSGVEVSHATIWRALRRAGFTMKKVSMGSVSDTCFLILLDHTGCSRTIRTKAP